VQGAAIDGRSCGVLCGINMNYIIINGISWGFYGNIRGYQWIKELVGDIMVDGRSATKCHFLFGRPHHR
jgi:hypothetical protein